ncbi:MAG: phosphoglycerate kinase [Candidatus Nealsonbacteria bacterium]|nr:MAG: phosphoglycerate kinase [Candidatus Nealsonbacteria bacterium]
MRTLKDFEVKGKRVLVRCDFNVPLAQERGIILDDFRIKQTLPTIEYLIEKGAKLLLMSHLGRPGGKVVESLRLTPIQNRLMEYLDVQVSKAPDCVGEEIEKWSREMQPGEILLLENLRFHKEEAENNENFAKALAKLGDIYINDAFSVCHRNHASIVGIPKYLPSGAGFLLEKEIKVLSKIIESPITPLVAIFGGREGDFKAINKISEIANWILIGGLIKKEIDEKGIILKYPQKIISPVDRVDTFDIGPKTINLFKEKITPAKTIFWSGPLGKIEEVEFQKGSEETAKAIIESGAFSVVGGGETVEFINKIGLTEKFNHVSTGGNAMLVFLAREKLPGLEALKNGNRN